EMRPTPSSPTRAGHPSPPPPPPRSDHQASDHGPPATRSRPPSTQDARPPTAADTPAPPAQSRTPTRTAPTAPTIPDPLTMTLSLLDRPKKESVDQTPELCRGLTPQTQQPHAIQAIARHNSGLGISR